MDVLWVLLAIAAIWFAIAIVVASFIGRAVKHSDEDARLFGSLVLASRGRRAARSDDRQRQHDTNPQPDDTNVS